MFFFFETIILYIRILQRNEEQNYTFAEDILQGVEKGMNFTKFFTKRLCINCTI